MLLQREVSSSSTACTVSLRVLGLSGLNQPQMENIWEKKKSRKFQKAKLELQALQLFT